MDKELNKTMMSWILGDDTGCSSQTLWAAIMGVEMYQPSIPYDRADFGRCYKLLNLCDKETQDKALKEVAKRHKIWVPFVKNWDVLTKIYESDDRAELCTILKEIRTK